MAFKDFNPTETKQFEVKPKIEDTKLEKNSLDEINSKDSFEKESLETNENYFAEEDDIYKQQDTIVLDDGTVVDLSNENNSEVKNEEISLDTVKSELNSLLEKMDEIKDVLDLPDENTQKTIVLDDGTVVDLAEQDNNPEIDTPHETSENKESSPFETIEAELKDWQEILAEIKDVIDAFDDEDLDSNEFSTAEILDKIGTCLILATEILALLSLGVDKEGNIDFTEIPLVELMTKISKLIDTAKEIKELAKKAGAENTHEGNNEAPENNSNTANEAIEEDN